MTKPLFFPKFERLHPTSEWVCEAMSDTSLLTLDEAATFASKQAGTSVSVGTILRAAANGRIRMVAIVRRKAKVTRYDGGVYCTSDKEPDNTVPSNSIPTLPLSACVQIANTGCASWRTFDGFEWHGDTLMRYDEGVLKDGEPDFETSLDDCRVKQYDVHALADALRQAELEPPPAPALADQSSASESLAMKPVPVSQAQEEALLRAIADAGYVATQLPARKSGSPGVKAQMREALKTNPLFVGSKRFDKAWERLLGTKRIQNCSYPLLG